MEDKAFVRTVEIGSLEIGPDSPLVVLCGPCVIEGEEMILRSAEFLKEQFDKLGIGLIFKASYDKANRSSVHGFRGVGIDEGLRIFEKVKKEFDLPVVTDVHTIEEIEAASAVIDVLQIPAFLSRQTDLIIAAAKSGRVVEVKKGNLWPLGIWNRWSIKSLHKITINSF